jgi:hypothetical protein
MEPQKGDRAAFYLFFLPLFVADIRDTHGKRAFLGVMRGGTTFINNRLFLIQFNIL